MAFVRVVQGHSQVTFLDGLLGTEQELREKGRRFLREEKINVGLECLKRRRLNRYGRCAEYRCIRCAALEFGGQGGVVSGEALFVDEDEGPFVRRRPCTGFFGGIGDVHAAARKESAQTDGDEFNGFSVFADNQDGDRLTLRHQEYPCASGESEQAQSQSENTTFARYVIRDTPAPNLLLQATRGTRLRVTM